MAGRLLLTRRQLLDRVAGALQPLFRWQLVQILFGVTLIPLGALCWTQNIQIPHRLASGIILHVYGVLVIAQGALVCTRIRRIDYSKPIEEIRTRLDSLQSGYLRSGVLIGFIWWFMWIPACVALGFDVVVLNRNSLIPSLVVGIIGFVVSVWLYWSALRPSNTSSELWRRKFSGESIAAAYLALEEIEQARIR